MQVPDAWGRLFQPLLRNVVLRTVYRLALLLWLPRNLRWTKVHEEGNEETEDP